MTTAINHSVQLPAARSSGSVLSGMLLSFLVFYTIALPKGGIKAGGVPLTIGYVLTVLLLLFAMLRGRRLTLPLDRAIAYLCCSLLGLWSALVLIINGTSELGFTISYFVSALYLPLFGLTFFSSLVLDEHRPRIETALLYAVRFVVVYGIFLFLFKQLTGKWIEIPYITVNVADVGQLDDKFINRGGIFKLISTYNNGNIFGVSLAIMAPLYISIERRKMFEWAMYVALFLTLSRTAWIAAILIMFMRTMSKGVRPIALLYVTVGILLAGGMIVGLLNLLGRDMSFVLDSNLGGRAAQLSVLDDVRIIPDVQIGSLPEIVYLGMLKFYGIPGFLLFLLHLLISPLILAMEGVRLLSMSRASACMQGLLVYVVVAGADAAYSFIPVMMIFWMVAGIGFWYAHRQADLLKGSREASR